MRSSRRFPPTLPRKTTRRQGPPWKPPKTLYAALTAEQKSLVSRYAELTAARTRLDAAAPTPDSGSESGKNSETEAGCGSNAAYAGFAAATVLLAAAVVLIKKKRA